MTSTLLISGSKIDVTIESGEMKVSQAELIQWVKIGPTAVATYYALSGAPCANPNHSSRWFRHPHGRVWIRRRLDQDSLWGRRRRQLSWQHWMLTHEMGTCRSVMSMNTLDRRGIAVRGAIARIQASK